MKSLDRMDTFRVCVNKLADFFGKRINESQHLLYYDELKNIPTQIFEKIVSDIIRTKKPMPSNFPSIDELRQAWYVWLQAHPEKQVRVERPWCDECGGTGYIEIWFQSEDKGTRGFVIDGHKVALWYNTILPCAMCNAYRDIFPHARDLKRYTREVALQEGFLLHDPYWYGTTPYWDEDYVLNDKPILITVEKDDEPAKRLPDEQIKERLKNLQLIARGRITAEDALRKWGFLDTPF